jgi:HlyD family secretion protein
VKKTTTEAITNVTLVSYLFLSLSLVSGCKKADDRVDKPIVTVQAVHPQFGDITEEISADATLAPIAQAAILPKITAPIKRFYVQRGSRVTAGQLVATLENQDLAAAALDNKGAYAAAKGAYAAANNCLHRVRFQAATTILHRRRPPRHRQRMTSQN